MSRGNSPYFSAKRSIERTVESNTEGTPLASTYHTQIKYELNWICFCVPIMRGLLQGWMQVVIIACFQFAGKSGVNSGIIASIFSSCVIITPIIFHFKHGQKLSKGDMVGGVFILACILLISTGGAAKSTIQ